jgi:hypothetical protein
MGIKGDCVSSVASIVSDLGRFWPICWVCLYFLCCCDLHLERQALSSWSKQSGLGVAFLPFLLLHEVGRLPRFPRLQSSCAF